VAGGTGLTTVLAGDAQASEAVVPVPGHDELFVLPAGPALPNPSEILSSRRMSELLFALRSQFDLVIADSPPVLPVTDAVVLSAWVEATLLVVAAERTTRRTLAATLRVLGQADAPLIGAVLNEAELEAGYGYSYGTPNGERPNERQWAKLTDVRARWAAGRQQR